MYLIVVSKWSIYLHIVSLNPLNSPKEFETLPLEAILTMSTQFLTEFILLQLFFEVHTIYLGFLFCSVSEVLFVFVFK